MPAHGAGSGAGSITAASVDTTNGVVGQLASSDFSTYCPVSDVERQRMCFLGGKQPLPAK
jgi:hypothetical protein